MQLNVIHLPHRIDRMETLLKELSVQHISDYRLWPGVINDNAPWTGVAQAHKQIVQDAILADRGAVLIAEDDIKFTSTGAFEYYLNNVPTQYDLYLGGVIYGLIKDDGSVDDFAGRTLYCIHNRFYKTYLEIPEDRHQDRALAGFGKFIVCNPMVCTQYNGYSDNNRRFMDYSHYLSGKKLFGK